MATVQCERRHFYDDRRHSRCPHCPTVKGAEVDRTQAAPSSPARAGQPVLPTEPAHFGRTEGASRGPSVDPVGVTVPHKLHKEGIDPVVGWLVCVSGVNRGRDYRLRSGFNKVGRATNMDVCIENDSTVTRDTHCQITYSPRGKTYSIVPDNGRNFVYVNGQEVLTAMALQAMDRIEIGTGFFVFQPLCCDEFDWDQDEGGSEAGGAAGPRTGR